MKRKEDNPNERDNKKQKNEIEELLVNNILKIKKKPPKEPHQFFFSSSDIFQKIKKIEYYQWFKEAIEKERWENFGIGKSDSDQKYQKNKRFHFIFFEKKKIILNKKLILILKFFLFFFWRK